MNVVFHAAAGPRIGFGHLVRCRSLARALGVTPVVSIRGTARTKQRAATSGWRVVSRRQMWAAAPSVVVVDDPSSAQARLVTRQAGRRGVPALSIANLTRSARFAVLDPSIIRTRQTPMGATPRVLIALGGGAHVFASAGRISRELARSVPGVEIVAAAGFSNRTRKPSLAGGRWVSAPDGLTHELSRASVAVVAGGVTLQEACALGVPAVAVAVVAAQRQAIRHFARQRAVIDAKHLDHVAAHVARVIADPRRRRRLSLAGRRLVDGLGVFRVADRIRTLHVA
jgi:spore coat polysaccharide biosynthesis predicted glycosyltransferase SpsG